MADKLFGRSLAFKPILDRNFPSFFLLCALCVFAVRYYNSSEK
jgi:hypothetical protein